MNVPELLVPAGPRPAKEREAEARADGGRLAAPGAPSDFERLLGGEGSGEADEKPAAEAMSGLLPPGSGGIAPTAAEPIPPVAGIGDKVAGGGAEPLLDTTVAPSARFVATGTSTTSMTEAGARTQAPALKGDATTAPAVREAATAALIPESGEMQSETELMSGPTAGPTREIAPPTGREATEVALPEIASPEDPPSSEDDESVRAGNREAAPEGIVPARTSTIRPGGAIVTADLQVVNVDVAPAGSQAMTDGGPVEGRGEWRLAAEPQPQPARSMIAAAPAPAMPAVAPQALAEQITLAIGRTKDRSVEIRLDPPELGRVQIHLSTTESGLQAIVLAERPETHDLLRRHAEILARDLSAAGFRDVSLGFATGGHKAPDRDEGRFALGEATPGGGAGALQPAASVPLRLVAGGLDIRL